MALDVAINTYSGDRLDPLLDPEHARCIHVNLGNSLTLAKGTLLGELTATPGKFVAYASGNADGSQIPKVWLQYAAATDASGNIQWSDVVGATVKSVPAYYRGVFRTTDFVGLDANAMAVLNGRLISGTLADGVVVIP